MGFLSGLASGLVGGAFSAFGASKARKADLQASQRQMDFQQYNSNTAYQRAMIDMRKAGLNPILAYKQGGASTPGGAQPPPAPNIAGGAATAGLNSAAQVATIENTEANTQNTDANAFFKKEAIKLYKSSSLPDKLKKLQEIEIGMELPFSAKNKATKKLMPVKYSAKSRMRDLKNTTRQERVEIQRHYIRNKRRPYTVHP